jgi:hypothetical protein
VLVMYKGFASDGPDWASVAATGSGVTWQATVPGTGSGGLFAVAVTGKPGTAYRYPDVAVETPYRVLAP